MAAIVPLNVAQEQKGRESSSRAEGRIREHKRRYAIHTSVTKSESDIYSTPGLPTRWEAHPEDPVAVCLFVRPQQDPSNPLIWYVECEYSTDYTLDDFDDPIYKIPEVEWDTEDRQAIVYGQVKGENDSESSPKKFIKAVCNSAGQSFDPPPTYEQASPVLVVRRVENDEGFPQVGGRPIFKTSVSLLYSNALNSDEFLNAEPETVRCKINAKRFQWRNVYRWDVTYRFAYRKEGWQPQTLDQGTYALTDDDSSGKRPFVDDDGNVIVRNLDGKGKALPEGKEPVFIKSTAYFVVAFEPLKIKPTIDIKPQINPA